MILLRKLSTNLTSLQSNKSVTCSCCGHKMESLPLSVRKWTCPVCSAGLDRDVNAAINFRQQGMIKLRAEGLSVPANGGLRQSGHKPVAA
ncbi:zinc ribbon domain-containing protein [Allopseudospirillum japonicum]|uniref:zinc ribbon domain-containing protein n=1 Tax=Allopseudospirillum japonicum TaxID=64971 RepID=UPI000B83520F|nr:zinc ribbon domain-containing protein [Allopseudospirillum japonicum]